jgi:hypothetical protein
MSTEFKESIKNAKEFLEKDFEEDILTFEKFKNKFIETCERNSL